MQDKVVMGDQKDGLRGLTRFSDNELGRYYLASVASRAKEARGEAKVVCVCTAEDWVKEAYDMVADLW